MGYQSVSTTMKRKTRNTNDSKRRRIRAVLRSYTSAYRAVPATPEQRLAAAVVVHAVEALWYGTRPGSGGNRWTEHNKAVYEITNGGIDLWLDVLGLPVDETIDQFMLLMPSIWEVRNARNAA